MSKDYGLKISKPGIDVKTATDAQLLISSKFPMFKILSQGSFNLKMYGTRLDGAVGSGTGTIKVDSTSGFRSAGYFWIFNLFGADECVEYTSIDATHFFGCNRGFNGTSASAFPDNANVSAGQNENIFSHGLAYPPVHFVFNTNPYAASGQYILCPYFFGFPISDPLNYVDAFVTSSVINISINFTSGSFISAGTFDQYDFIYMIMADSIEDPYY